MDSVYKCVLPGVQPKKKKQNKTCDSGWNSGGAGKHGNSIHGKGEGMEWGRSSQNSRSHLNPCSLEMKKGVYAGCNNNNNNNNNNFKMQLFRSIVILDKRKRMKKKSLVRVTKPRLYISRRHGRRK